MTLSQGRFFYTRANRGIHPFPKNLRFSWLGAYSRFTCKAVTFDDGTSQERVRSSRNAPCDAQPSQNRTCPIKASGSS
ncbi:Hypothetical protein LUCI_4518 [Lucifera butyrica]|uniref:Uncharacterized protein n=1 Tax=Lucifera butyrica TaxID=1351585 RepID=A0A498RJM3_9FIRM|nr:Hypothetical protein LUCI_4518 [Lucifera butyrica]